MRILLFGDGRWATTTLRVLVNTHEIPAVVTRRNPTEGSLESLCHSLSIPLLTPRKVNDMSFYRRISGLEPDLCLSVSYDQLIGRRLLELPRLGFVNLHASLLPEYRGRASLTWQLINGEDQLAVTLHRMSRELDRGQVIYQYQWLPAMEYGSWEQMEMEILEHLPAILNEVLHRLEAGVQGRELPLPEASYFPRRREGDEDIDWNSDSERLFHFIRALNQPGLGARTWGERGEEIRVLEAERLEQVSARIGIPGSVIHRDSHGVVVKTGDTALRLTRMKISHETVIPVFPLSYRFRQPQQHRLAQMEARLHKLETDLAEARREVWQ